MAKTLRPRFDPAIARRRLDDLDIPLDVARRRAVRRAAGTGRTGARARGAGAGPPARRAAGQPRPAGPSRVPPRPGRRRPRRWLDGAPVVARHHRHRAGLRPAARARRRQDAARPVDRRRHRRAPGDRGGRRGRRRRAGVPRRIFPGPTGERLSLVRGDASVGGRPATLEEVVLGHLAAARATAAARSPRPRGKRHDGRALRLDPPDPSAPPLRAGRVRDGDHRPRRRVVRRRRLHRRVPAAA